MVLSGQYDSPYVRRVAVSLRLLGFTYEHDARSIFGDFDAMRTKNPVGRIPALTTDDGEILIDSGAVLDWIDQEVGPDRALVPPSGPDRQSALQRMALATGLIDKAGAVIYERRIRPAQYRWQDWIDRCLVQANGALEALGQWDWPEAERLNQAHITAACAIRYLELVEWKLKPRDHWPELQRMAARCEALPAFQETNPADYQVPQAR
jgi:glutathione S-transferase